MQLPHKPLYSFLLRSVAFATITMSSAQLVAQEQIDFFDDFSADSIGYIVDDRPSDNVERSYEITPDGLTMRAMSLDGEQRAAELWISDRTDTVRAQFSLSSETPIPTDPDTQVRLRISGNWYNEIQDGGLGNSDRTGDVYGQARMRFRDEDRVEFSMCLDRRLADGSNEGVDIFDGNNCIVMPDFSPMLDTVYEVHMTLDRAANTIAFGVDGQDVVTPIGQAVYLPAFHNKQIQVTHRGSTGQAVGIVSGIGTDGDLQAFPSALATSGPYRPLFDLERGISDLTIVDERVRYEVRAPADSTERLGLTVFGTSERIQAAIELASESVIAAPVADEDTPFVFVRLGGTFYNDTAEGGFNENEGNVFASILILHESGESPKLQYCLYRSDTADFSSATELVMQNGTDCGDFDIDVALDTSYNAAIDTDLAAGTVTFSVDEEEHVHTISTMAFAPENTRQFINVQARASSGSTAIAYLDDYGTSSDAPLVASSGSTDTGSNTASSGGGGGGCSVGNASNSRDPLLFILSLIAIAGILFKQRRSI